MLRLQNTLLLCSLTVALSACKVSVNSSSPDDAKPNVSADAADAADEDGSGDGDTEASDDPSSTLTSKAPGVGEEAAVPSETEGDAAPDPSSTLTSEAPATCEDGAHKVGDTWKDDCNTCSCKEGGKSMCTRMACKGSKSAE